MSPREVTTAGGELEPAHVAAFGALACPAAMSWFAAVPAIPVSAAVCGGVAGVLVGEVLRRCPMRATSRPIAFLPAGVVLGALAGALVATGACSLGAADGVAGGAHEEPLGWLALLGASTGALEFGIWLPVYVWRRRARKGPALLIALGALAAPVLAGLSFAAGAAVW